MIRRFSAGLMGPLLLSLAVALAAPPPAFAQGAKAKAAAKAAADKAARDKNVDKPAKPAAGKPGQKPEPTKPAEGGGKPALVASSGEWGAYTAGAGKAKTCYALAKPKDRAPASLKRDPGYLFISNRPGESVKNEVSFVMGFEVKTGSAPKAEIGSTNFELVAKGSNLWVKNPAEEPQFIEALRKGQKLVVKAQSKKGNPSTDSYLLAGMGQMLDRASKDCQ
jgi:hypothetical protein